MNKDTIIRMAREAGIFTGGHPMNSWSVYPSDLERFAALVAAHEREACARTAQKHWDNRGIGQRIAAAIRSMT